ncbi:aspartate aminotransferase family protein [Ochrobactrum sp. MYb15]|uniref:class-III pyridoxal-phosphate-dependent aminotransferase n=1 Tax=Brucella pituitosa TaxID=571256 RepID=UPI000CFD8278|nr:aspartate aminotransferase family protein [Ochrobactrum sp. MYb19]PRA60579.1 aspartate aminotransferase family protein [Ochrobactrum sp. MYb18]PRA73466.1 aspartate aminotransferase family protein [Brucella thiophenivorans]PRA85423.1 aspartate aminotransferase family protein [Ochrobactrum sp. MYb14]PRA94989.1 aspartate aminotransferase family protein [Ochrobactrum sp. MYb15]
MTQAKEETLTTSAEIFGAFIERSWRSNAERQLAKGAEFVIGRREGVYMWDVEGERRLIDCGAGGGVHALGHRHPDVLQALRKALDDGRDTGLWSVPNAEYLKLQDRLAALAPQPSLNRSVVTLCSTLSVDLATMFAFRVTKRQRMLAYRHGYHGHTGFAAIVTGSPEEGIIDHYNLPTHATFLENFGDTEELDRLLTKDIAAFIIEPMDYETFAPAPKGFLEAASRLCQERGIMFIMDETRAGLGRTGTLWATEQYDIEPAMLITGKGLSGGLYPASAVLMRDDIYEECMNKHRFAYISSLGGNEISCVVAAQVLEIASSPKLLENVKSVGAYLSRKLDGVCQRYPDILTKVSSFGLAISIELTSREVGRALYREIFAAGVLCHSVSEIDPPSLKLFPPLVLTNEQADEISDALDKAAGAVVRDKTPIRKLA